MSAAALLLTLYAVGVAIGLAAIDDRLPTRIGLAILWPLGPVAFVATIALLLAAAPIAFFPTARSSSSRGPSGT